MCKNYYFIFIFILFKSINIFAQDKLEKKALFGLQVSCGISDFGEFYFPGKSSINPTEKSGVSYSIGLSSLIRLRPKLYLNTGIHFKRLSSGYEKSTNIVQISSNGTSSPTDYYIIKLNYLIVPLLVNYKIKNTAKSVYFLAGTELSYLTSSTFFTNKWYATGYTSASQKTNSERISVNNFDIPLVLGIGKGIVNSSTSIVNVSLQGRFGTVPLFPVGNNKSINVCLTFDFYLN